MPSSATNPDEATTSNAVTALLETQFGLHSTALERLLIGQGTVNYRAQTARGQLFVKSYPPGTDLAAEAAGIRLSALAADAGVPVAQPLALESGSFIAVEGDTAASVWEYVDGQVVESGLNDAQLTATGTALGTIHRVFAALPESSAPAHEVDAWLAFDPVELTATVDRLLGIITAKPEQDSFDTFAEHSLRERRTQIGRIPDLIHGLPDLTAQVLHGDYSAVNLMFRGDELAAVLDFRPPNPFLVAYELGRIAFDPRTVTIDPDWDQAAIVLIAGYLTEHPDAKPDDIAFCARVALIQLLTSLYGVKNHYLKPGLLQDDLDAFWSLRHRAATRLLERLPEIEKDLRSLTAA